MANEDRNTREGRAQGGQNSGGNFKNDPQRAAEAGRKGGQQSQSDGGHRAQQGDGNFANDRERAAEAGRKGGQK